MSQRLSNECVYMYIHVSLGGRLQVGKGGVVNRLGGKYPDASREKNGHLKPMIT